MKKSLRITPFPSTLDSNPYISIIYDGVAKLGVKVVPCKKLTFRWLMKNGRDVDILHFHWPETHFIFNSYLFSFAKLLYFSSMIILAKILGCKIIWTAHNILGHEKRHEGLDLVGKKLIAMLADAIVAHCDYAAKRVRDDLHARTAVHKIPHPNYLSYYKNETNKNAARSKLGLPDDKRVYLLFGAVRRYKGVLDVIDAFRGLAGDNLLVIAGSPRDDALRDEIAVKANGSPNIRTFLKFVDDDEVQDFFNAADFVILPYKDIVTSGALILAMSFRRAVIAPDTGHFSEMLGDGAGILYETDKNAALKEAIMSAAAVDACAMGERCYEKVSAHDTVSVAKLHLRVYESVTGKIIL